MHRRSTEVGALELLKTVEAHARRHTDGTVRLDVSLLGDVRAAIAGIEEFINDLAERHEPLTGEAYPLDRNRYCAVCMSADGGSSRWPCGTIRAARKFLCASTAKAKGV